MPRKATVRFAALLAVIPALLAWKAYDTPLELGANSRLWIAGTSTVRSFECKAAIVDAIIEDAGPGSIEAIFKGEKAVRSVAFTVPSAKMDCGNGKMNEHMMKALKAKDHPVITFRMSNYDLTRAASGMQAVLTGELTLGGVTKTIAVKADGKQLPDGTLDVSGTHQVRMSEFGLTPPSLMMGAIKVGDKVDVNFELFLSSTTPIT